MMGPLTAIGAVYTRPFQFRGRACRAEYWWTVLFNSIVLAGLIALDYWFIINDPVLRVNPMAFDPFSLFTLYFVILKFFPMMAVTVRRLHDGGFSGFWILLFLVPPVCGVLNIAMQFLALATNDITGVIIVQSIALIAQLVLFILLVWPSEQEDNIHGAGWRPVGDGAGRVMSDGSVRRDPRQAYAMLYEAERKKSKEEVAAREAMRKDEVRRLYEERVLGRPREV